MHSLVGYRVLHRNRRAAGSIPARALIVAFFATAPGYRSKIVSKAPFTLRSIFGAARIKLVPVPLFWFLDYLFSHAPFTLR